MLYAMSHDLGIDKALQYGSAAASIVISQLSSSAVMPTAAQIEDFLKTAEVIN